MAPVIYTQCSYRFSGGGGITKSIASPALTEAFFVHGDKVVVVVADRDNIDWRVILIQTRHCVDIE